MTIYLNDERDYSPVVEGWVREFISTMDDGDDLEPGNDSGDAPFGVKIIFDGYGYDEETNDEQGDKNTMSFAVFVHKDSLTEEFPPHELTPWALIHRPKEEACMWVWYYVDTDDIEVIPFEADLQEDLGFDEEIEGTFNVFGLCERYVRSMPTLDSAIKERVLSKITSIYQKTIKDEK